VEEPGAAPPAGARDVLAEWLAKRVGLSYYHIDPLKIDVVTVTAAMSHAYAERFKILPVDFTAREVVVATAEPYVLEWQKELEQALHVTVRTVVATPSDIIRYLAEFYNLARSVKRAMQSKTSTPSGTPLRQLPNW
jgi:general secretion pathway protein E